MLGGTAKHSVDAHPLLYLPAGQFWEQKHTHALVRVNDDQPTRHARISSTVITRQNVWLNTSWNVPGGQSVKPTEWQYHTHSTHNE